VKIIVGHTNMDLDCIASMVLARYLFPDHTPVRSRLVHPVARNLYNLYQNHLDFLPAEQLSGQSVERVVVVDTRSLERVREFLRHLPGPFEDRDLVVFDHHSEESCDIPGAVIREKAVGANTTLLGLELLHRNLAISAEDATIALTGIYADTGNFTHENVQYGDFQVAAFCLQSGASLGLVSTFLKPLKEEHQLTVFHQLLNRLRFRSLAGHLVLLGYLELDRRVGGLSAVAEKIFEVESPDLLLMQFHFRKERQNLIVARSQRPEVDVRALLQPFGGSGHRMAASALVRQREGPELRAALEQHLASTLPPALTARRIMSADPSTLQEGQSLLEASLLLEKVGHTGAPVLGAGGELSGFLSLRDIMKGRRAGQMNAPVKAYMSRNVVSAAPDATIREVERLLFTNNIGHLPIVENGTVAGIVTRSDLLCHLGNQRHPDRDFLEALRSKVRL
jgi:tRNA nucleotidyltransferase (CCA-adding enzyme)